MDTDINARGCVPTWSIKELREDSARVDDAEMVEVCDAALAGDVDAIRCCENVLDEWDAGFSEDADPNDCPECARSYGPHYRGPCQH